ncbi:Flavodoxin reductases (ferredoxin-NADPH reductases) family 1, partial [hydrothermal vent metagenome]
AGCEPFAEDKWKKIRIGEITFRIAKPCSRCVIPNIDPETAEKSAEPNRTLSSFRRRDNKIFFGQNVIADNQGKLELGMSIEILE